MKISKSSLVLTAAFTGLLGGTVARAATVANTGRSAAELTSASSAISPIAGQAADDKVEKHACKGLNSCKGKGGCKTAIRAARARTLARARAVAPPTVPKRTYKKAKLLSLLFPAGR